VSQAKWTRKEAALAAEASPNTTAPLATAVMGPLPRPPTGSDQLWIALADGTSCTVQLWAEVEAGVWIAFGAPIALLAHAGAVVPAVPSGCSIFPQVTAAAGAPTTLIAGTVQA